MVRQKTFIILTAIVVLIGLISLSLDKQRNNQLKATRLIGSLYEEEVQRFDSSLNEYAKYFYDSSYATRVMKYGSLVRQFKKIEGLFTYFHKNVTYETFLITPRFQKRDFGLPFPDNWLFIGPFGIEPDSILKRSKKADTLFTQKFIERAVKNFKAVISESNYREAVKNMTDADVMESLRP